MKIKKGMYVIAPEGCEDYFTPEKKYVVEGVDPQGFYITDDEDDYIFCLEKGCIHLNGGDWIVVPMPAVLERITLSGDKTREIVGRGLRKLFEETEDIDVTDEILYVAYLHNVPQFDEMLNDRYTIYGQSRD